MGQSTMGVTLGWGAKTVRIKAFPDLGGPAAGLEATDLSDTSQVFVRGVSEGGSLEFTLNYSQVEFNKIATDAGTDQDYTLTFPDDSSFTWSGQHFVTTVGAGTRAVMEMKMTVIPSSKITFNKV